jgi:putative DNA primase/helicase
MSAMPEIADQARNHWRSLLPMFGIDPKFLTGKHGPCPICDGKDRFRFDDKEGRGTFFCSQCGPGDGVKLLMRKTGQSFAQVAQGIREKLGEARETPSSRAADPVAQRRRAGEAWNAATPIFDDDAARYLAGRNFAGPYPTALRFCPSARTGEPTPPFLPAMLALVTGPDGQSVNLHRTFLENGSKASSVPPRKMMAGTVPEGSAIRLGAHTGILGVAEGIETALRVTQRLHIPCWSLIDAEKMKRWLPGNDVRELHIFGDNDRNGVGQAAAWTLYQRIYAMRDGPQVFFPHIPAAVGKDWADFGDDPDLWTMLELSE